jgi:anti-sigma factor RsiW
MGTMLSCREFVDFLADYLAGQLSDDQTARFNAHLASCPSCVGYTRSSEATVRLGRDSLRCPDDEVPGDVPEDLVRAILDVRAHEA